MDFELTDDQVALQEGVRSFCEGRFPIETVRSAGSRGRRRPRPRGASWPTWACSPCACPRPTVASSSGWADAVLVFEELGRALVPGPAGLTSSSAWNLAAAKAASQGEEHLPYGPVSGLIRCIRLPRSPLDGPPEPG